MDRGPVNPNSHTLILSEPPSPFLPLSYSSSSVGSSDLGRPFNSQIIGSPIRSPCLQLTTFLRPILIETDHWEHHKRAAVLKTICASCLGIKVWRLLNLRTSSNSCDQLQSARVTVAPGFVSEQVDVTVFLFVAW